MTEKETTISGEDLCECGHHRRMHSDVGCWVKNIRLTKKGNIEKFCKCERFTLCSPKEKRGKK